MFRNFPEIFGKLKESNRTVATAESCTGGMLGAYLTSMGGSSQYFEGGVMTYSDKSKTDVLGVDSKTIKQHGAVSSQTACEMAEMVRRKFQTDFGISITGIAGPGGGSPEKPVGTVWIGIADRVETLTELFHFSGSREEIRIQSCIAAINKLIQAVD